MEFTLKHHNANRLATANQVIPQPVIAPGAFVEQAEICEVERSKRCCSYVYWKHPGISLSQHKVKLKFRFRP